MGAECIYMGVFGGKIIKSLIYTLKYLDREACHGYTEIRPWAVGAVVAHFVDIEGVTGSNPVLPTKI